MTFAKTFVTAIGLWMAVAGAQARADATLTIDLPAVPRDHLRRAVFDGPHTYNAEQAAARERAVKDSRLSVELYNARLGNRDSQLDLGIDYLIGVNTPRDIRRGIDWLTRAAGAGSTSAMYWLGRIYSGTSDFPDVEGFIAPQRAVVWYSRAADAGDRNAAVELANLYAQGNILPKDDTRAEAWYLRAADQGDIRAELLLAKFDLTRGNAAGALTWYRRAAGAGNNEAMTVLCDPPPAFTAEMRVKAHQVCAAHLRSIGLMTAEDRAIAFPPDTYFDLKNLPADDRAALAQTVLAALDDDRLAATYPPRAHDNEVEGWGEVACRWTASGGLADCAGTADAPPGYGFAGHAAVLLNNTPTAHLPGAHPGMWSRLRLVWHLQP